MEAQDYRFEVLEILSENLADLKGDKSSLPDRSFIIRAFNERVTLIESCIEWVSSLSDVADETKDGEVSHEDPTIIEEMTHFINRYDRDPQVAPDSFPSTHSRRKHFRTVDGPGKVRDYDVIRIKMLYVNGLYRVSDIASYMVLSTDKVCRVLESDTTKFGPVDYKNRDKYPQYNSQSFFGKKAREKYRKKYI